MLLCFYLSLFLSSRKKLLFSCAKEKLLTTMYFTHVLFVVALLACLALTHPGVDSIVLPLSADAVVDERPFSC